MIKRLKDAFTIADEIVSIAKEREIDIYSGFAGDNWNDNVFYHHITDNTDIPDLFEYLSEGGFTIYFEDYPCHSLLGVDIIYYDSNGDKFEITFDDIIDDWKNKSYEEICDFLNSL